MIRSKLRVIQGSRPENPPEWREVSRHLYYRVWRLIPGLKGVETRSGIELRTIGDSSTVGYVGQDGRFFLRVR
jgi:hypothetical protein